MNKVFVKKNNSNLIFIVIFILIFLIIINIENCIEATKSSLLLWCNNVVPTLFPFLFLTKLLSNFDCVEKIAKRFEKLFNKIFNAKGISSYVLLMSLLCGYPIGAKIISDEFNEDKLTQNDCNKIVSFCCTSGVLFTIGTIGVGMFKSSTIGIMIFVSMLSGTLINGLIFSKQYKYHPDTKIEIISKKQKNNLLYDSMYNSVISVMIVGGYIVIFAIISQIIFSFPYFNEMCEKINALLGFDKNTMQSIIAGILEMTNGSNLVSKLNLNLSFKISFVTFFVSFGGISVAFQSFSYLGNSISKKYYFLTRFVYAFMSSVIAYCLTILIL